MNDTTSNKLGEEVETPTPIDASLKTQLTTWHSGKIRIIPSWRSQATSNATKNPFKLLAMLDWRGWIFFFSGWWAWTCDGYDFFSVSLTANRLAEQFGTDLSNITKAITLTLLFRSVGAIIFGLLADRFGRKWTLIVNLLLIAAFELGSGFCQTFSQFLAVRSLFGVAMGGIWGQAAGYSVGCLLAAAINLGVVSNSPYGWRSIYFVGAGFSTAAACIRAVLPESEAFLLAREESKASGLTSAQATKNFMRQVKIMLKTNWLRAIWAVCMMTGLNFMAHASGDLYPTFLQTTKHLTSDDASKATIITNVGAVIGGAAAGYASQYVSRRLAILCCIIWAAGFIPLWLLPSSFGVLAIGGFLVQAGVQGALGVIPIYLGEISPPAFRASFAGLAYQLGNAASCAAAEIEADAGASIRILYNGVYIPNYAAIMGIMMGAIMAWVIVCTLLGPEADEAHFEQAAVAFQDARPEEHVLEGMDKPVTEHQEFAKV